MEEILFKAISINNSEWIESMTIAKGTIKRKRDCVYLSVGDNVWVGVIPKTVCQFIGYSDKNGTNIFSDDILTDGNKNFRVYATAGGFAIKAWNWASDINDLTPSDELILSALPDAQTRSYIEQSCWVIGSIHDLKDETNG